MFQFVRICVCYWQLWFLSVPRTCISFHLTSCVSSNQLPAIPHVFTHVHLSGVFKFFVSISASVSCLSSQSFRLCSWTLEDFWLWIWGVFVVHLVFFFLARFSDVYWQTGHWDWLQCTWFKRVCMWTDVQVHLGECWLSSWVSWHEKDLDE